MAQIGSILRESRIRMGLSLKEVAEITKVRAKYLQALEDDDYGVIPGPTFIKAYLRTYASALRVDGEALVDDYRSTYERRRPTQDEYTDLTLEHIRNRSIRGTKKRPVKNTRRGYALAGVLAIAAVVSLAVLGSRGGGGEAVMGLESVGVTTTTLEGEVTTTTLAGIATTTTSEAIYTGNVVSLRIEATGDCQVTIRKLERDGDTVFSGTMRSGDVQKADGAKRYYVLIGSPDAVKIFINDLLYNSPDDPGEYFITETKIEAAQ